MINASSSRFSTDFNSLYFTSLVYRHIALFQVYTECFVLIILDKVESDVRATVFDLAELPVLVLPWPAFDGADCAGARLFGHVQFRAQAAVRWKSFAKMN